MSEEKDHSTAERWVNQYCGFSLRQDLAEKDTFTYANMIAAYEGGKKHSDDIDPAMKEWVKKLEKNSVESGEGAGGLIQDNRYIHSTVIRYQPGSVSISLNGEEFTASQLEALARHIRSNSIDPNQQSIPDP